MNLTSLEGDACKATRLRLSVGRQKPMRDTLKQIAELGLLGIAFLFAVPPVSSTPEPYDLMPGLVFAGVAFAGSLAFSLSRKAETWPFAVAKLILFLVFALVLHFRVAIL